MGSFPGDSNYHAVLKKPPDRQNYFKIASKTTIIANKGVSPAT
jgi:hypothetical protein